MPETNDVSNVEALLLLEQAKVRHETLQLIRGENNYIWELAIIAAVVIATAVLKVGPSGTLFSCVVVMFFASIMELLRLKKRFEALVRLLENDKIIRPQL
ncbi:MAG: hypothetical protein GX410_07470 [Elusimicrobia bacterium]|nr:hypothetical protein [Elusimicrobiota bacterium]